MSRIEAYLARVAPALLFQTVLTAISRKAEEALKVEKKLCSVGSGSKSLNLRTPRPAVTARSADPMRNASGSLLVTTAAVATRHSRPSVMARLVMLGCLKFLETPEFADTGEQPDHNGDKHELRGKRHLITRAQIKYQQRQ